MTIVRMSKNKKLSHKRDELTFLKLLRLPYAI